MQQAACTDLDYSITGASKQQRRNGEAECFGGLKVYDEDQFGADDLAAAKFAARVAGVCPSSGADWVCESCDCD